MGHRHFLNSSNMFGINQGHDNNSQSQQSYHPTVLSGGLAVSENGVLVTPLNNISRGGVNCDHQRYPEDRLNEYASSSFYREVRSLPPPFLGNSYYPCLNSEAADNLYMHPHLDRNASQMNSSYYNRQTIHDFEGVIPDPLRGSERGSLKRKHPGDPTYYGPFERGSTSRSYGTGCSSGSSHLPIDKPPSDYQGISLGPISLHQHRGNGHSVSGEDLSRNVRSRSRYDVEPVTLRTHFSSYPSQHYHSATSQTYPPASSNADQTRQEWNHRPFFPAVAPRRGSIAVNNGVSPMMNQFIVGGSASSVAGDHHGYLSSGHPVSISQNYNGTSAQVARESGNVRSRMSISAYRNGLNYSSVRHEAITPDVMHSQSSTSRYTESLSAGGLHNSYMNMRSNLALERLQPISSLVGARHRNGIEVSMTVDNSSFYGASRSLFDQYRDMRLDVDSMSYEELLALEETIGNVSTGVSEDMISKCLSRKKYSSVDQNCVEGSCAICLEEYKTDDGIGTLKNCGHDHHVDCITKWLLVKNVCPICKAAALTESTN